MHYPNQRMISWSITCFRQTDGVGKKKNKKWSLVSVHWRNFWISQSTYLAVTQTINENPPTGKPSTCRQVAVQKLGLDIHHNHETQKVKQFCTGKRLNYCGLLRVLVDPSGSDILVCVFFSDEAGLHLRGYVNSHNSRICSKAKLLFSSKLLSLHLQKKLSMFYCFSSSKTQAMEMHIGI